MTELIAGLCSNVEGLSMLKRHTNMGKSIYSSLDLLKGFLLLIILWLLSSHCLIAQGDDLILADPLDRPKATLPLPFGISADLSHPILFTKLSVLAPPITRYHINAFYDTWELNYDHREAGNLISIGWRTIGREFSSALMLVLGSKTVTAYDTLSGQISSHEVNSSAYAIGIRLARIFPGTVQRYSYFYTSLGLIGHNGNLGYFSEIDLGTGIRLPVGPVALNVGAALEMGVFPNTHNFTGLDQSSGEDISGFIGLSICSGLAFNFQID